MTTDIQKEREKAYASQLARTLECEWFIDFPPDELEWPDLVVNEGEHRFGIEIREITKDKETRKGSVRRANESLNNKKVQKLAGRYYEKSNIPLKIGILGNIDNEDEILGTLLEFVSDSDDWSNLRIETKNGSIIYATRLPAEIGIYKRWEYVDDRVGWVREIDSNYLIPFVTEKEKKTPKYKKHLSDIRLLLVADPTYSSGQISFIDSKIGIKSEFSEVYLLVYPNEAHYTNS
jgi:hypothetical protein